MAERCYFSAYYIQSESRLILKSIPIEAGKRFRLSARYPMKVSYICESSGKAGSIVFVESPSSGELLIVK
jgi:hypothetical protein